MNLLATLSIINLILAVTVGVQSSIFGSSKLTPGAKTNNAVSGQHNGKQISIQMPDIRPDRGDQYLCMTRRVKPTRDGEYIVGFNPIGDAGKVHHMLLYGCQLPGIYQRDSPNFVWDCSGMHANPNNELDQVATSYEQGPVCQGKQHILYGWALDAPALRLPQDVGFKIGGMDSDIDYLVLQVHYGHHHAFDQLPDLTDNSGLLLDIKPNDETSGITRRAGVLILISLGYVPEGKSKHEIWCEIKEDIVLHPFRYRVHTHTLGTKVIGAKIGKEQQNNFGYNFNEDSIIGVGDPQKPQTFYPVKDKNLTLSRGDSIYARCEFNNNRSHPVQIGSTGNDEMCNFYMMYWTDSPNLLSQGECFNRNPVSSLSSLLSSLAGYN